MELPQQNLPDPLPGGHGGHINQPQVVQQMPNAQNNALGAVQVQFNRQQQNSPAGGILGPQDPVEVAFRAAEQLNANQQRYVPPAPPLPLDRNQLIDLVQETYGPALRPLVRPSYHKPYPDYIDRDNPFPRGFKVPEFTLFSGDASQSTIEHIGRFTIQCGEVSGDDFLKLRLFPSSLIGTALTWYLSLPQISMFTWRQMEGLFHIQFYRSEPEISMAGLSRLTQRPGESSKNYLMRFRKARMKCHVALPEQEFVKLAQNGLDIELRKKFEGMEFRDFFELSYKVARYENLLREESQRKAMLQGTYYQDAFDLDVAVVFADKLVTCPNLVKVTQQVEAAAKHLSYESRRQYTFDVIKANEIFDYLKKLRHIKLPQGHRLPTVAEIASKDYYKIDKGLLRFPEKPKEAMGVDENPFPNVDVGVNVDDIRSISQRTYKGRTLAADDLRWIGSISINLSCLVLTLPLVFQAKGSETTYVPTHVSNGSMFVEEEVIEHAWWDLLLAIVYQEKFFDPLFAFPGHKAAIAMPRKVGKEVAQQVEVTPEEVDSAESSNKISQELQQIRKLQEEANQNMERSLQSFLQAQQKHSDHFTQCLNVIERAIHDNSRAIREEVAESRKTLTAVSERTMEHVRQQQNVPRQPVPPAMELPQQNLPDPLPGGHGGHINQPQVVQQMPNAQNNALGAVQMQFNRQQQNNLAGGILGPQDLVEAALRAADQLNANQQRYVPLARRPNAAPQPNFQNNAFQLLGLQVAPPPLDRNQLINLVQETYGPALRPLVCPSYHKPYPDYIDRDNPFPRGFKASGDDFLKLRLFPSSLTGTALTWYLSLPQNSVFTWRQMEDLFHIQFYRSEPEISMADLSRLTQRPGESSESYLMRFRKARMKCHVALPEQEFVKLAKNGLDIELRKKFEGMEFRDFFELSYKVARYENLLREESQRKATLQGTYYQDAFNLDVAEVFADKPITYPNLVKVTQQVEAAAKRLPGIGSRRLPKLHPKITIDKGLLCFPKKPKEAMGVDENPFPNVDVGVNVADIRSISRRTYKGRTLAADDLRWVIEKERERRAQQNQRLGGQHHAARIYASGSKMKEARHTDRSRMVKPPQRPPSKRWEKVVHPKFPKELGRMVWKRKESQEVAVQNESQPKVPPPKLTSLIVNENELKASFEADQQVELTSDDNLLEDMDVLQIGSISINLSCLVITLPLVFQAKGSETTHVSNGSMLVEEEVIEVPAQKEEEEHDILSEQIIFNKPDESVAHHIKPLYISAHMDGVPVNRVLVDNGAAVNVIPSFMLRNLDKNSEDLVYTDVTISDFTGGVSKSKGVLPVALTVGSKTSMSAFFVVDYSATYNALLGRDWIHSNWCVPSSLHQRLIFWNGGKTEVVYADNRPFLANSNMVEARYYDEDVGTIRFFGMDRQGKPRGITACNKPTLAKYVVDDVCNELLQPIAIIPYRPQEEPKIEENTEANLSEVVHEGEEDTHTDGVTMEELDLAPTKLDDLRADVQDPLKEVNLGTKAEPRITFVSLDRELVEHRLPINKGYKPYKQPPRRMSPEVILKVKEEVERLHKVGFIRTTRYSEWLSNIVPIVKKNGKLRVCIDFRNLNLATPKDEYPMSVADLLVDGVTCHRILSFMDGHSGYNQIFIAEEEISKTAFRCPGNIAAMNAIFHDMIGRFMEIYIDDVVVKSMEDEEHLEHLRKAFERMRQHGLKMNPLKCAFGVTAGNFLGFLVHERGLEAVKGQALADFLADHPCLDVNADEDKGINLFSIDLVPWRLIFDGSSTDQASGAGIIIVSPDGIKTQWCFQLDFECTNNQAEYEALVIGLELLVELKVPSVEIMGDSQLVLKQLSGEYKCTSVVLSPYFATAIQLLEEFDDVSLKHIPRNMNIEANELGQIASGVKMPEGILEKVIVIEKRMLPSIHQRGIMVEACSLDVTPTDWRHPIIEHLRNPSSKTSRRTRMQALNYVLLGDVLYRRGQDELLLRCLGLDESYHMMSDVHNGICGAHQAGIKMRWLIRRHGFFWPSILKDCINYVKGCRACQLHGPLQRVPASEFYPIVKPWPFRGWAIDLIGKIYPPSSKGHSFIIVATDYFTKWVEARPMKKVEQGDVIKFIKEDLIHRFGFRKLSLLIKAYRTSQRSSTKVTPFSLTYGHDAVLPMELTTRSLRIAIQNGLNSREYNEAMIMELEDLEEARLTALDAMKAQELKVARAYNKTVKQNNLAEGRLVWKAVLPLGKKDPRYGKWSPNWEGPFQIHKVLKGGAYWLKSLNGELHLRKINGIHLKPYYPIVWEARDSFASTSA
ncbi:hypothetical protein SLEP1_g44457 [Rubroshorea leprosula]|uniref:RNase H type-1 domain-containing protein n=1 Tax=Rubroshorea leprosula TaxID=152421 RepID=A0AAV5LHH6_9ROSI|nr:hypothetical protein SLEP1_g44457 [Rubroshorea leprosula]